MSKNMKKPKGKMLKSKEAKAEHIKKKPKEEMKKDVLGRFVIGNIPHHAGTKGIMKAWNKGKKGVQKCPEWKKEMMSETMKGNTNGFQKGHTFWLGKKRPDMKGSNHFNWQGGTSLLPYPAEWTDTLKESIRQRDNYVCQECEVHQDEMRNRLAVHHIDYNKDNCDPVNLITLCGRCHLRTNFNREHWVKYFQRRIL